MPKLLITLTALLTLITPVRANAATNPGCPKLEATIARYFPKKHVRIMSQIAWRESRCNPKSVSAVRRTGYPDVGLLQIQGSWRTVTYAICRLRPTDNHIKALTRLDCNLRVAQYLYRNGGLGHWRATSGQ